MKKLNIQPLCYIVTIKTICFLELQNIGLAPRNTHTPDVDLLSLGQAPQSVSAKLVMARFTDDLNTTL